ncbi:hypothetical protein MKX03_005374 [Papaver bracteatum]|nr:hypothetical protein MKX03_005374 [Papaver bracteatum]
MDQVTTFYEDGRPVDGKGIGRKVMDRAKEIHNELAETHFAYDGERSLFTVGSPFRNNKFELPVVLAEASSNRNASGSGSPNETDRKRMKRPCNSKTFKVEISFATKIPMQAIANALRGQENESSQEALRVLDIVLRQHAAKQGCLLVRQSFFHNEPRNFVELGGGVQGCRGFHSSFRTTQGGLSLNIDVSTTITIRPGPVLEFLLANQNVRHPNDINWDKAKRTLRNLRIKVRTSNSEYKITGLSELPCRKQTFTINRKGEDPDAQPVEVTVYDYYVTKYRNTKLHDSANYPCINVGKPKRPTYIPIELCELVSLQRYTKALSNLQRSSLVEKSRQKPQERMTALKNVLQISNYGNEPMLKSTRVTISPDPTQIEGRVLSAPKLKVGNGEEFLPRNGRWNFNNKKLAEPTKIGSWAVVNFSARCDTRALVENLARCCQQKGIVIDKPLGVFDENPQHRRSPANVRVDRMSDQMKATLPNAPRTMEEEVVSSRGWPFISKYRASVRTQSPKVEMIDSLFKKVPDKEDEGIVRELLLDFYHSSKGQKPEQIIIFRDGVSESQFNQVLNIELDQIIEACKELDAEWKPKFTVIIAQKNHHTKFFQKGSPDNVPPGTVIDKQICHPRNNDFYLCAHAGMIGTTRPTHYHVLWDEIGFSADNLQELVHSLSYVYQRSTTAISVVAPVCYAHLAAAQMLQFLKSDEMSESSSSHGGVTSASGVPIPELPRLHRNVRSSMFFC